MQMDLFFESGEDYNRGAQNYEYIIQDFWDVA